MTETGSRLSVAREQWIVCREGAVLHRAPVARVDLVLVHAGVEVTAHALNQALMAGTELCFLGRNGDYRGRLQGPLHGHVQLRVAQVLAFADAGPLRLEIARRVVAAKIHNQRVQLQRFQRRGLSGGCADAIARLGDLRTAAENVKDVPGLMGHEGLAARTVYALWPRLLAETPFLWEGRIRRPPPDPANALLGYLAALAVGRWQGILASVGLDPMIGALHGLAHGRPALALDLLEPWRPILVDGLALTLMRKDYLRPSDFEDVTEPVTDEVLAGGSPDPPRRAVHLDRNGRRIVLARFFEALRRPAFSATTGRRAPILALMTLEARTLAREIRGEDVRYLPHRTR